jgi:transposase
MDYSALISETEIELTEIEKKQSLCVNRDRIRFLKLLKTQQVTGQAAAGEAIGLGQRQAQRLWATYRKKGLDGLVSPPNRRGWGNISCQQISYLRQFLLDDQAQTLAHIQAYLAGSLGLEYTISGVSNLCRRLKIKAKTGRPVNVRQKPGAVEEFKKKSQP